VIRDIRHPRCRENANGRRMPAMSYLTLEKLEFSA